MNPILLQQTAPRQRQSGAASLAVVMVLFFVVSLAAAYTSRNLIFEQKTSANQYRGTLAFEAADAGVDWALSMLNGGRVNDAACANTAGAKSFAERYLTINESYGNDAMNGRITATARAGSWPTCVYNGATWTCTCPDGGTGNPAAPTAAGILPAYRVWLAEAAVGRPYLFNLKSSGCTKLPASAAEKCLDSVPEADLGDGMATVTTLVALRRALAAMPAVPVLARGDVTPDPASGRPPLRVVNPDLVSSFGITVQSGGTIGANVQATSVPGTPGARTLAANDPQLAALSTVAPPTTPPAPPALSAGERMFVRTFGMKRNTYLQQSGLRVCASPCTAGDINALAAANPNRIIWAQGDVTLDADVGTAAAPVMLIVDGATLTLGANVDIVGYVYLTGAGGATSTIQLPAAPTSISGGLAAEGALATQYAGAPAAGDSLTVTYDATVLNRLRTTYGTWVRVGGSWRDFTP